MNGLYVRTHFCGSTANIYIVFQPCKFFPTCGIWNSRVSSLLLALCMVSLFAGYLTNNQHLNWSSNCRSLATCCTIYEQRQNQKPRPLLLFFACFVNTEGTAIAKMQMAENMHSILFSPSAACYEYFQKLNIFGIDN